jgi:flavin-dependent dehydrogenase
MGATSVATFRLASGGRKAEAPLPFRGAGLSRYRLDEALLKAAAKAGAEVVRPATVTGIESHGEGVSIKAGAETFEGGAAALATGKHALRQLPRPQSDMVGFKLQVRVTPEALRRLEDVVQLVMFDGGYIGACIVEDRIVTLCWVMQSRLLKRIGSAWPWQAAHFASQSVILRDLLASAEPEWEKPVAVAGIPYGFLRREPIAPNVYPLGDQLAVIPSFTGDGMAIALYTGIAAAQAVLRGETADVFQRRMIDRLTGQFRWAGAVNLLFKARVLHQPGIVLAAGLPRVVTWLAQSTRLAGFEDVIAGPAS